MKSWTFISPLLLGAFTQAPSAGAAGGDIDHPIILLNEDQSFHYEILSALAEALSGGADINPLLRATKNIIPGDFGSFNEVFYALANDTKAQAMDPANAYDPVNVRDTWFSASTYFRRADSYMHENWEEPLINKLWEEQLAAFDHGLAALPVPGTRIQIPADNFTVEAIWYTPSRSDREKRPTLILGNGYDGAQEDLYHIIVAPALARGWNCLTYEGPGQPTVRRRQNLGFIPDWERVVTPLVDYLLTEKASAVDAERLALFGYSFGGYLAARAAAFEPRLKAVLVDGGVWDFHDSYLKELTPETLEIYTAGKKEAFDEFALGWLNNPKTPTSIRWGLGHGMWAFRTHSTFDLFEQTKPYNLKGIFDRIQMPMWIADGQYEGSFAGQPQILKDHMGENATLHVFRDAAGYHVQAGAFQELARVMFAWLHETLG